MSLARKCDRCGDHYNDYCDAAKYNSVGMIDRKLDGSYFNKQTFDLCPECKDMFEFWLFKPGVIDNMVYGISDHENLKIKTEEEK